MLRNSDVLTLSKKETRLKLTIMADFDSQFNIQMLNLFEKVIVNSLTDYLGSTSQHGFRSNGSNETALYHLLEYIYNQIDKNNLLSRYSLPDSTSFLKATKRIGKGSNIWHSTIWIFLIISTTFLSIIVLGHTRNAYLSILNSNNSPLTITTFYKVIRNVRCKIQSLIRRIGHEGPQEGH